MLVKLNKKYPTIKQELNKIIKIATSFSKLKLLSFIKIRKNKEGNITHK